MAQLGGVGQVYKCALELLLPLEMIQRKKIEVFSGCWNGSILQAESVVCFCVVCLMVGSRFAKHILISY